MFTDAQLKSLTAPLDRAHVRQRQQSGRSLDYVEGWWAIAEANRIFGFDSWTRETLELKCVSERERKIGKQGEVGWGVTYIAKVRVSVRTGGEDHRIVVREGCGTGHGIDRDLGQAHESALKEAETDAMKRALMTFGNPFGLALYDKEQRNVCDSGADAADAGKAEYIADCERTIRQSSDPDRIKEWWTSDEQKQARRDFGLSQDEANALKNLVIARLDQLGKAAA